MPELIDPSDDETEDGTLRSSAAAADVGSVVVSCYSGLNTPTMRAAGVMHGVLLASMSGDEAVRTRSLPVHLVATAPSGLQKQPQFSLPEGIHFPATGR